jgi:hypothetical protein
MTAKGLAMTEARGGNLDEAMTWLADAYERCTRWPDAYQWIRATILDVTCGVAIEAGDERAADLVDRLATLAARTDMRLLVVHAQIHAAHLGQPGALEAAAIGAASLDNPVLTELVNSVHDGG